MYIVYVGFDLVKILSIKYEFQQRFNSETNYQKNRENFAGVFKCDV